VIFDGQAWLTVATQFGIVKLPRRVCYNAQTERHVMPGNTVLPSHEGMLVTRGLQEWACLLPQTLPFESAARLLGWQTQEAEILSSTTVRTLVRTHGQHIRQAEQAEVEALLQRSDLGTLKPRLAPAERPRRRPSWPAELNDAVETALEAGSGPPEGVSMADWERVLAARRQEASLSAEELRHLGPELEEDQVLVTADEVLTRRPEKRRFWELRTARIATQEGYRYLSGVGGSFLQQLLVLLLLCAGSHRKLLLIADGARWIRTFFTEALAGIPDKAMILDWYHLRKKCYQLCSLICRGRKAKAHLLFTLYRHLWRGKVEDAIQMLEAYRPYAKREAALDELIAYLQERRAFIPDYCQRRQERRYIGSGHSEKANDLIVARRQKRKGMHWSLETSDALAALQTLMLNRGWELYWSHRQVLPLVAT